MTPELIKELQKLSMGTIAVAGLIWVLHAAVKGDASEKLVQIYSGDK